MIEKAQLNDLDVFSCLVGALCHDLDHDGFNNQYHHQSNSNRRQLYGEKAIQEQHHLAVTLKLMQETDFLRKLSDDD